MKSLLNTPDIEPIKDADFLFGIWPWARGPMWELQEPWAFTVDNGGFKADYHIPEGYRFDKASVPSLLLEHSDSPRTVFARLPPWSTTSSATCIHGGSEWLQERLGKMPESPPAQVIHRHFYDKLVLWGMRPAKARIMWEGVRNFGPGGRMRPSSWFKRKAKLP
jgi:hypothetical protein